jgi:ParB-like chromosome segregation protein Spo0J
MVLPMPRRAAVARNAAPAPPSLAIASQIVMRDIRDLIPYARNSRTHSEEQILQLMAIIREFGFTVPLLTAGVELYAGHARVLAGERLGLTQLPTIDISYLTPEQRRGLVIADNKIALNAGWDEDVLLAELAELDFSGFDLSLTGFSGVELKHMGIGGLGEGGDAPAQATSHSWAVIVECANEADQVGLIDRLQREGRKVRGAVG